MAIEEVLSATCGCFAGVSRGEEVLLFCGALTLSLDSRFLLLIREGDYSTLEVVNQSLDRIIELKNENEVSRLVREDWGCVGFGWCFNGIFHGQNWLLYDKVTVLESEKRAWENSPDAQAVRDALNPWRHVDTKETNKS